MENVVLRPGGPQHRMIESRVGRTERAEIQRRRGEPRALAEPYDRDVQVRADDRADAAALGQLAPAPGDEAVEDVVRKPEPAEEPDRSIALHATGRAHSCSCRLWARRRRTRWRADAAARRRTVSRSAGRLKSAPSSPSGPCACTYTRPTGFSGVPPPGPATPVTDTATSTPRRERAPEAIAAAVSAETAPCRSSTSAGTPSADCLTSFA